MRKILLLSVGLALVLVVVMNVQRIMVLTMTNRPFLGTWTQNAMFFSSGPPNHIEFERGGNLWISRFGEARRQAHWEEGSRGREIVVTGFDPARPKARESYHWDTSRTGLMLFPMPQSGPGMRVTRFGLGSVLGPSYVRASSFDWPAPQSFVGRWTSPLGRAVIRMRNGQLRTLVSQRVLLDVQPGGKLWLYPEGQPRRRGSWTADEMARMFTLMVEPAGPSSGGEVWAGRVSQGLGHESTINFGARRPLQTRPGQSAFLNASGYFGTFRRVAEAHPNRRPFLGVWRTRARFSDRHLQLELLPGGKLRVTDPDGSSRRGTWRETGLWPRLTLTNLDPKQPGRETEWFWSYQNADRYPVYGMNRREFLRTLPELLELFDAHASTTDPSDGTALYLERVGSPTSAMGSRSRSTHR